MSHNNSTSLACNYFIVDHNADRKHSAKAVQGLLLNYSCFKSEDLTLGRRRIIKNLMKF